VLVNLATDQKLSKLVEDLPADIMNKILQMAPDGVLTGSDEQNVMDALMYCTDKYTLSDPAVLAMHNYIVDKVHPVMFEPPLAESFEMLVAADQQIMHNVLVTDTKFSKLVADLPADIKDNVLKAAPAGKLTGSDDQNVMDAFMYCTDKYTLSDPTAMKMHNHIVDKLSKKSKNNKPLVKYTEFGEFLQASSVSGTVDFKILMQPLAEDSKNKLLKKLRDDLDNNKYETMPPQVEDFREDDASTSGRPCGRRTKSDDILKVIQGLDSGLTDEFHCEIECFIRDCVIDEWFNERVEVKRASKTETITLSIAPIMSATTEKRVEDCFLASESSGVDDEIIFQLLAGREGAD